MKLFIAGASGVVGKALVAVTDAHRVERVAHYRPGPKAPPADGRNAVLELSDRAALEAAMQGCTTVASLIGTMRNRFARGDTYETSDIGTTRTLLEAARATGVGHFLLLSSVGAGRPVGAYLQAKAKAERLVRESGIPFTLVRPSALDGEGRHPPPGMGFVTRLFGLRTYQPISVETVAQAMLAAAQRREPLGEVLEGGPIWEWARSLG